MLDAEFRTNQAGDLPVDESDSPIGAEQQSENRERTPQGGEGLTSDAKYSSEDETADDRAVGSDLALPRATEYALADTDDTPAVEAFLHASKELNWSGMLPDPVTFAQYPSAVQERMMRWNDAYTVDESARQDRLVDAEIAESVRGSRRAVHILMICLALASAAFFIGHSLAGAGLFLGLPVLGLIGQYVQTLRSASSRGAGGP